jgi:single-stranded DNA-binding protein
MPGGQYTRVTVSGVIARDATVQRAAGEDAHRATARFGVQARGTSHTVLVQGPLVEHIAERLGAGHGVRMEGRIELHRWQDNDGRPHERATIVIGGPESQIRVDRQPIAAPALGPEPKPLPTPELPAPAPMRAPERSERTRR